MNNDLISREALRNSLLDSRPDDVQQSDINFDTCDIKIWLSFVLKIIDNAPTVDLEKVLIANVAFDEDKLKEIVQTEVIEKIKSGDLVIKSEERPQVEEITNDDVQQAIKEGFANGYEMAKEKFSPKKGEWIVKTISTFPQYQPDEYVCPFCKTIVNYKTNFCHKCGSDMRGAE